ncbi:hypothetical protein KKH36_02585 [Patescibacteria group bacterium]|nr:hypothetical protein [Patescibacteria group bacterium]
MKNFFKKINRLSGPLTLIIISIILGGFYYAVQVNKQNSIKEQQWVELQAEKNKEDLEYVAQRKLDCLAIYEVENEKWNNVKSWNYNPIEYQGSFLRDYCEIIYTDNDTDKDFIKTF